MTELEALVALNSIDIGHRRFTRLLEHFSSAQKIIIASADELIRVQGIGRELALRIKGIKNDDLRREFETADKLKLSIISISDDDYPQNLKQIYDPALVLYVKGRIEAADNSGIAVVGSRKASFYGLSCAEKLSCELSEYGLTVISGLARGVDTAAHRGALKNHGRTIAVMGSGFAQIYPPENKGLCEEIANSGAVVSEFPVFTPALPQNFPRRNRIISGLSKGVLVIEAARNSGALITADFALEQGREVFALPGKIDSENSFGTNYLIQQGAKLVTSADSVIEELGITAPAKPQPVCAKNKQDIELDKEEKLIYNSLSCQGLTPDQISRACGINIAQALSVLFKLEMKKAIRQLPGKRFLRN